MTPLILFDQTEVQVPGVWRGGLFETYLRADSMDAVNTFLAQPLVNLLVEPGTATKAPKLKPGADMFLAEIVTQPAVYGETPKAMEMRRGPPELVTDGDGAPVLDEDGFPQYARPELGMVEVETEGPPLLQAAVVDPRIHLNFRLDPTQFDAEYDGSIPGTEHLAGNPTWVVMIVIWATMGDPDIGAQNKAEAGRAWSGVSVIDPDTINSPALVIS